MAYNGAGIYGIYNVIENQIYIGKSSHISRRIQGHKQRFKKKDEANKMYSEPIENFVFFAILKMSDVEFRQYGNLFESLFIVQAVKDGYGVYNKDKVSSECLWEVLSFFGIFDNLRHSLRDALDGTEPHYVKIMTKDSRAYLLSKINNARKTVRIEIE